MGEVLEVAKVLVEPASKLIDVVQSAIGKVYEPRHIRKMADARAYEIATVSSAMRESSDIPIEYRKGDLMLDTTDFDAFVKRTQSRLAYQELQKQYNIETISNKAYELLEGEDKVPDDPLDSDWINRLFNYAGDISNEKMQEIWAAILAGEVKQPTSFSLRTLDTLHNISQSEAELFQRISHYLIYEKKKAFFPNSRSLRDMFNIKYSEILRLDECGLINSSSEIGIEFSVRQKQPLLYNSTYVLIGSAKDEKEVNIRTFSYPLTAVGFEIAKIFDMSTDNDFFIAFAKEIKKSNPKANFEMYKIIKKDVDFIEYADDEPVDI